MNSEPIRYGGRREGAGRKKTVRDGVKRSVMMQADTWERLHAEVARRLQAGINCSVSQIINELVAQELPPVTR